MTIEFGNTELVKCVNPKCKKTFRRFLKANRGRRITCARGARMITCCQKCSKAYMDYRRKL